MLFFTLILLCANALALVPRTSRTLYSLDDHDLEQLFEDFIVKHAKQYGSNEEKQNRFEIFKQNVENINKRNSDPNETASFDINRFTDLTLEEFKQKYTGFKSLKSVAEDHVTFVNAPDTNVTLPDSFDWRTKNAVSEMKDQGACGSCWAFSTTGAIEGAYGVKHGAVKSLSESQLVDCDKKDKGCGGGNMQNAISYLVHVGGQMSEADYPYQAQNNDCKFDVNKIAVTVSKLLPYNLTGELDSKNLLIKNGPVSIAIDSSDLMNYQGGILKTCTLTELDHAVLLVGYSIENGSKYYIIKNSWGTTWGEKGYLRVAITDNPCGMYNDGAAGAQVA